MGCGDGGGSKQAPFGVAKWKMGVWFKVEKDKIKER